METAGEKPSLLSQKPYLIAAAIAILLILWMASGIMKEPEVPKEKQQKSLIVPKVKVETLYAENVQDAVELYGRTEPNRVTTLKAEVSGRVDKVVAVRGASVSKNQIIVQLETNDIPAQIIKAQELLKQRKIEFQGAKKLNADGYQGEVQLSKASANLAAVKADIKRLEIALEKTVIRAPFDGVLNSRFVEQGDYLKSGDEIAVIADLDPLIVSAHVTENQVSNILINQPADIRLLNKKAIMGKVRYIASVADEYTNTFKVEIVLPNPNFTLLAGLSGELSIGFEQVPAIKISPALLALDQKGNIGVKTVKDDRVVFTPIDVVKSENDGMWLAGLGAQADVITLGQGFVREGDQVEAVRSSVR